MYSNVVVTGSCENCGASLECRRQGTRFCDGSCRAKAWLRDHPERDYRTKRGASPRLNVTSRLSEPSNNGKAPARRRLSRDGRGVRLYVLPEDDEAKILAKVSAARGGAIG